MKRAKLLVEQYNEFEPLPGLHVNGELTLGENIGDLTGLDDRPPRLSARARRQARTGRSTASPAISASSSAGRSVAREVARRRAPPAGADQPARARHVSRERPAPQHPGVLLRRSGSRRATRCSFRRASGRRSGDAEQKTQNVRQRREPSLLMSCGSACRSPTPTQPRNPRIAGERLRTEFHARLRERADGTNPCGPEVQAPGLLLHGLGRRERATRQHGHVDSAIGVAGGFVADDVDRCGARVFRQRLTGLVVGAVGPRRTVCRERRPRQIHCRTRAKLDGERGELAGIGRPRCLRRFGEEQQPMERHFGDRRGASTRGVEDARREAGPAEARAARIGRLIAERGDEQVMQVPALRRNRRVWTPRSPLPAPRAPPAYRPASSSTRGAVLRRPASSGRRIGVVQTRAREASR